MMLIDAPVNCFSEPSAVRAWLEELRAMPKSDETAAAIVDAELMLERSLIAHG